MVFLKKKYNLQKTLFFTLVFFSFTNCFQKNLNYYQFWKGYDHLQRSIKSTSKNEILLSALAGSLSEENEAQLQRTAEGYPYLSLYGNIDNQQNWNLHWNEPEPPKYDYLAKVIFTPKLWDEREIYTVERKIIHKLNGYQPRDFFKWLNDFVLAINDHNAYQTLKSKSQNLQFLCNAMQCHVTENAEWQTLEFTINEDTKAKFPGFYQRTGSRLEKTKLNLEIWDRFNPTHKLKITNQGKTIQFHFPVNPPPDYFLSSKEIRFLGDFEIKSFGITVKIQNLEYKLKTTFEKQSDTLDGHFVRIGKKEINGNFFYIIPQGFVNFFIPGNMDEYFNEFFTLLIQGTQGRGGSQIHATFKKTDRGQINSITTYNETKRKRFSLFGGDDSQKASNDFDFYASWEEAMLLDLK
ncbi:hypothetical protein EHQ31_18165 [Leptospira montravelensis]|uniref:Lipoprotein n=1 Tax=Leptospira montravelensis TaxID=2484961 RepID=A0ABY2LPU9_9LEPT|nr:hypothetical protein [Leptospira montravelensis]TGK80530.1 hypothetical protein EHQ19_12735 [Leptospira montravelensis]TGL00707.1 hypothetical protein EHQ31_18165 [Leptospira montravelensis]